MLILSDIHGNLPALEAVIESETPYDTVVFCGDVVDYGPMPVETLRWIARNASHAVRGNHDNALGYGVDCQCMGSFREYSVSTREWHKTLMSEADIEFLKSLPTMDRFILDGKRFHMAHATPQGDMFEYIDADQWERRVAGIDADFVLLGHTHIQGMRTFAHTTVVNPGSIGLARDHASEACYAVYQNGSIRTHRMHYDVQRTLEALRKAPISKNVVDGLSRALTGS